MPDKTCNLCGIIIYGESEMCETCFAMLTDQTEIIETAVPLSDYPPQFESNYSNRFESNYPQQFESNHATGFESNGSDYSESSFQNPFEQNYQTPPDQSNASPDRIIEDPSPEFPSNYAPAATFSPPIGGGQQYSPYPSRPPRQNIGMESKPSVWYWFTELPGIAKLGIVTLVFSLCFAFTLKFFMRMDLSTQQSGPQPAQVSAANLEPQKPWFSGWFRSNPTGEEIFEKYAEVTKSAGKKLTAQSFVITGKAQFLHKQADGKPDLVALKKGTVSLATQQILTPQSSGKITDFDIDLELSLKHPNKVLMKMTMTPKDVRIQGFIAYSVAGFDGTNGWGFTQTQIKGKVNMSEETPPDISSYLNPADDGLSMTFLRSMYPKIEFLGEAIVFNRKSYWLKATNTKGEQSDLYFDQETGLATKIVEKGAEVFILGYQDFNGTQFPSKMVYQIKDEFMMMTMDEMKPDAPLEDFIFQRASYQQAPRQ